ncbi:hypothetical protein CK203_089739 [Vitis vinifera]|uniref:Integrase catalytic domain-containing protein n=1 Tax=Vitis vinifera TaxID=29760 RepID=A0A438BLE4_VITVI|nr:hypothetical protein CK203_089739 [Vitis vinifera]
MEASLVSKSLPSVGYFRKSYLQVTSQRLARGKLVDLHGRRSLALPSVGPGGNPQHCTKGCEIISQQKGDFAALCKILPSAWSDLLAMAVTPSFQLGIAHYLKHWIVDFMSFEMGYGAPKLVLHEFELSIALPWIPNNSPQSWIALIVSMTSITGWRLYFDGAANQSGFGIGILLISPQGDHIPRSTVGDPRGFQLGYKQTQGIWRTWDEKLKPYHAYLDLLIDRFDVLRYIHLPRAENQFADAFATLASLIVIPAGVNVRPLLIETRSAPACYYLIGEIEDQIELPWYHDIYQLLSCGAYPESASTKDRRALRQLATRFVVCGDALYRRSPDGLLLLCLDRASADRVMREVHAGRCQECQMHGDLIHVPPSELHALTSPLPFSVWGIDIIGKISPKSSSGHEYILVAIDYFTKWRVHFKGEVDMLIQEYGIQHHRSSAYRPQTNGAVEAANKNIKRILRKMVETSRDWSEKLPFALWAYRTSFRTSIGATPYSLVYGMEAVLPVEIEMGF